MMPTHILIYIKKAALDRLPYLFLLPVLLYSAHAAGQEEGVAEAHEQLRFDVWEYRIGGNTLLDVQLVEKTVYPLLGADRTIDDVEAARAALEKVYRDAGYPTVLVNIPEQSVDDGVVRLEVLEGRVDRLRITGSRYFSLARIRAQVPSLAPGVIPDLASAQAQLNALNRRSADRAVMPVLRPGRTPGTVEVELRVKDQFPLHGSLELNDRYSISTTRLRLNAALRYDNLWQKEHSVSLQYQTSPEDMDEVQVWVGSYVARAGNSGNILALYAVHSESDTATVGTLAVIGQGEIYGARGILPLRGTQRYTHSLTLGVDFKDFNESILLQGADALNTPISYVPWSIQYGGTRFGEEAQTRFSAGVTFGIRGLGNDADEFDNKRFGARPNFIYLRAGLERDQPLFLGMRLSGKLEGQLADSPLVSNEQFSAGGAESVRGYHESERLGDDAVFARLELSRPLAPFRWVEELRPFLFAEGAALRLKDPLPEQADRHELASAGAGLRLRAKRLSAALDWAHPFEATDQVARGDDRVHFSIEYAF